jgi:hypothetical protein
LGPGWRAVARQVSIFESVVGYDGGKQSSFNNNAAQEAAAKRAKELAKRYESGTAGDPVAFSFDMKNVGTKYGMKNGELADIPTTKVFAKLFPDGKGGWDARTMFPFQKKPTTGGRPCHSNINIPIFCYDCKI